MSLSQSSNAVYIAFHQSLSDILYPSIKLDTTKTISATIKRNINVNTSSATNTSNHTIQLIENAFRNIAIVYKIAVYIFNLDVFLWIRTVVKP